MQSLSYQAWNDEGITTHFMQPMILKFTVYILKCDNICTHAVKEFINFYFYIPVYFS